MTIALFRISMYFLKSHNTNQKGIMQNGANLEQLFIHRIYVKKKSIIPHIFLYKNILMQNKVVEKSS